MHVCPQRGRLIEYEKKLAQRRNFEKQKMATVCAKVSNEKIASAATAHSPCSFCAAFRDTKIKEEVEEGTTTMEVSACSIFNNNPNGASISE